MSQDLSFGEVLDAADHFSYDEQAELVSIIRRRLIEASRQQLLADVQDSRRQFADGLCIPATPDDLMREILK